MKLLFLTDNFPPEVNAPATRTYEHAYEWHRKGVDVTIITCAPNFPHGKVYEGYRNRLVQKEVIDGIKVIRVWSYVSANTGFLKRILDYISFAVMAFFAGLFIRTDLVVATSPQFFTALSGRWLSFFKRKPWIMEVRDLWPESIRAVGAMNGESKVFSFLEKLELRLYRNAKRIVVVTDTFKEKIVQRGIPEEKIDVIKNGVLLDKYKPIDKNKRLIEKYGLDGQFVVGYIGTHGLAHALEFILRSAKSLSSDITILLLGDGAEKQKLVQIKNELELSNVLMLPFVSKDKINDYISLLDVALVNLKKSDTFKTVIPSKIFENAAMGKPILLGVEGESKRIIETYHAGLCFEPENSLDFVTKLYQLQSDKNLYNACVTGCASLVKDFNRKMLAQNMLNVFDLTLKN